ncbi:MAG: Dabb family protein [Gammaproteobacteria bacterium]|nr:Dabb family protein [Gammaproteobacteria bacterium]MDH5692575.1 Dabb family protein [Gammaproteobacteria bacterium]
MIKHIVMWRLKDEAAGKPKLENARLIKEKLEALNGKIPGMLLLEVGINFETSDEADDVILYSEFESLEALDAYQIHPEHLAVKPFIKERRTQRRVVDYEVN